MTRRLTRRAALRDAGLAAGGLALALATEGCGDGRAAPGAETRVPLADLTDGAHLRIDHHGEPVEVSLEGDTPVARSLICTHQRCTLFWHGQGNEYRCPCHGATFDASGAPATGPVAVPMWRLPVRIEADTLVVGGADRG